MLQPEKKHNSSLKMSSMSKQW